MSSAARATYRQLLRVRGQAFRGDSRALTAAQQEIRSKFEESRGERDPARIAALLQDARDAAQFLSDFVVQGERTEQGNFAVALKPQHAGKQVEVPRMEEEDPDSGCCTRAPPAPPASRPK